MVTDVMSAYWFPSTPNAAPVPVSHTFQAAEEGFKTWGEERTRLFVKTARSYHRAFAETRSASPERALRYPYYLKDKNLPGLLGPALRKATSSTCWCA
jgi:hypothetical protein